MVSLTHHLTRSMFSSFQCQRRTPSDLITIFNKITSIIITENFKCRTCYIVPFIPSNVLYVFLFPVSMKKSFWSSFHIKQDNIYHHHNMGPVKNLLCFPLHTFHVFYVFFFPVPMKNSFWSNYHIQQDSLKHHHNMGPMNNLLCCPFHTF